MATLRDIQRRIRSVQSTQKITRAMKLVAAAKLRRVQERILAARPYAAKMGELLGNLVTAASGSDGAQHPLLEQREGPRRQIVIITADKGLAGAFNSNVIRRALDLIRQSNTTEVTLVVVGVVSNVLILIDGRPATSPWSIASSNSPTDLKSCHVPSA